MYIALKTSVTAEILPIHHFCLGLWTRIDLMRIRIRIQIQIRIRIPFRIKGFDEQKSRKKITTGNLFFYIFWPKDMKVTGKAFSSQKRTPSTSKHENSYFFLFLRVIFALLNHASIILPGTGMNLWLYLLGVLIFFLREAFTAILGWSFAFWAMESMLATASLVVGESEI